MPNWVRNIVNIDNNQVIRDCVVKKKVGDTFDFNKIIPMPEELDEDSDRYIEKLSIEEQLLFKKKYGDEDNWYDWRIKNWDTKWNANETTVLSDNEVIFDTAWSPPFKIFKEISRKYHARVEVMFADEGIVENSGTVVYEDGIEVDFVEGDEEFCKQVWNY